jgi:hypothetical protein
MKKQIIAFLMLVGILFAGNANASDYSGRLVAFVVAPEFAELLPQLNAAAKIIDLLNEQGADMIEINATFEQILNAIVNA